MSKTEDGVSGQVQGASGSGGGATGSAEDRATSFQAVAGNEPQHYSGEVLLVAAYALVWAILLGWVAFVWRRQRGLDERLADLERVIASSGRGSATGASKGT
jgi:CcmD family protein